MGESGILNMRKLSVLLLLLSLSACIFAQTAKIWVDKTKGGTAADQSYFDTNIPDAVKGSGYTLAGSQNDSDFYITITLEPNTVIVALYNTQTKNQIGTNGMGYERTADMNAWNRYLVNDLLANTEGIAGTGTASTRTSDTDSTGNTASTTPAKTFSTGRRAAAAAENLVFGLGSYLMGDMAGGLFVTTGYAFAVGFILLEYLGFDYESQRDYKYNIAGFPGLVGFGIVGVTTLFGIIRPSFYQKSSFADGHFSGGARFGMALLNPLLGMGSYIMGDWLGGLIMTAGYGTAFVLLAWDIAAFENDPIFPAKSLESIGIPGIVGMGVAAATVVFGFIRPFFYHRTGAKSKTAEALKDAHIAIIPNKSGVAVSLGYTLRY
jgi:hypothetical protein